MIQTAALSEEAAQGLAREWFEAARRWATVFSQVAGLREVSLEERLRRETLAFGVCLLEFRLGEVDAGDQSARFCAAVRQEIIRLSRGEADPLPFAWRRLPAASTSAPAVREFSRMYAACVGSVGPDPGCAQEIFRDFCLETGLGSDVLVGKGANLASILYYLVVHGCVLSRGRISSERKRGLHRAARECRALLGRSIERLVIEVRRDATPTQVRPVSSTPLLRALP